MPKIGRAVLQSPPRRLSLQCATCSALKRIKASLASHPSRCRAKLHFVIRSGGAPFCDAQKTAAFKAKNVRKLLVKVSQVSRPCYCHAKIILPYILEASRIFRLLKIQFIRQNISGISSFLAGREKGREGKGREGKGREGKGREGKGREGKGREGKGREGKGREGKGREGKGREGKGREGKGREGRGREGKGTEGKGREGKGREQKGTEGNRREQKGTEGNRREQKGTEGNRREQKGTEGNGRERKGTEGNGRERKGTEGKSNGTSVLENMIKNEDSNRKRRKHANFGNRRIGPKFIPQFHASNLYIAFVN